MLIMMFMLMMLMLMDKPFCTVDQWMDPSQTAVSRTIVSTACRMLQKSMSRTTSEGPDAITVKSAGGILGWMDGRLGVTVVLFILVEWNV